MLHLEIDYALPVLLKKSKIFFTVGRTFAVEYEVAISREIEREKRIHCGSYCNQFKFENLFRMQNILEKRKLPFRFF